MSSFARKVFRFSGWYGIVVLVPHYFLEDFIGRDRPPAITHPEFFYGFIGVALAFQFVFLLIARDPARYRPFMIPSILEKVSFGAAVLVLVALGRAGARLCFPAAVDLLMAGLFWAAYRRTPAA